MLRFTRPSRMQWAERCGIRFPAHVQLQHRVGDTRRRGVFSARALSRGELIAVIPNRSVVHARDAGRFLSARSPALYADALRIADRGATGIPDASTDVAVWFSRDRVLLAAAIAAWRLTALVDASPAARQKRPAPWEPFEEYLRALPRSRPLTALARFGARAADAADAAASSDASSSSSSAPGATSRPLVDRFATPLDVRRSAAAAGSAAPRYAIPSSSVDLAEAITAPLHLATQEHVGRLERAVHDMAAAFADSVVRDGRVAGGDAAADAAAHSDARAAFEWAHFMLRSRCVNPDDGQQQPQQNQQLLGPQHRRDRVGARDQRRDTDGGDGGDDGGGACRRAAPLLVPLADMLNHSMRGANVSVAWDRHQGDAAAPPAVLLSAACDVPAGGELLLNYAHFQQRGRFAFAPSLFPSDAADAPAVGGAGDDASPLSARNARPPPALMQLVAAQRGAGVSEDAESWLWQFGFALPAAELEYTREAQWSRALRGRVARMMDVRRKGRPGEFVVGVPEGLAALRRQRERVERELYRGARVFPREES